MSEDMSMDRALHILARVHTRDDHKIGFTVEVGAIPGIWLNNTTRQEYYDAWALVRKHLNLPFGPECQP